MDNKAIVKVLKETAQLMELHQENPFKIRVYSSGAFNLDKNLVRLADLSLEELRELPGVGKSLAQGIFDLVQNGSLQKHQDLLSQTPKGLVDLLKLKGIGPKKLAVLWTELQVENANDLREVIESQKVEELKGFGKKTQESILKALEFSQKHAGMLHFREAEDLANSLHAQIIKVIPGAQVEVVGGIRRKMPTVEKLEWLIGSDHIEQDMEQLGQLEVLKVDLSASSPFRLKATEKDYQLPVVFKFCSKRHFGNQLLKNSGSDAHLAKEVKDGFNLLQLIQKKSYKDEKSFFDEMGLPFIPHEIREGQFEWEAASKNALPKLVEMEDIKGILHCHSTYSDGKNSIEEMAVACIEQGYQYLGLTDHSRSAVYAGGLRFADVQKQHAEIDELNKKLAPFKIFKGIESDILSDGSLDYETDILASFDFIIASIHSGLKMDVNKATNRLLNAIHNPYTTMLGHPTGRLLLRREGYPIDHKTIIDACAEKHVGIEINAHPWRLDLQWEWVHYALEKGVMLSLNPDAHEVKGYDDVYYGLCIGRKGGMTKEQNLCSMNLDEITRYFAEKKAAASLKV